MKSNNKASWTVIYCLEKFAKLENATISLIIPTDSKQTILKKTWKNQLMLIASFS